MKTDVIIENHGTIFMFQPMTEQAENWIGNNVADPMFLGSVLCCEHRFAEDLANGMIESGLSLQ